MIFFLPYTLARLFLRVQLLSSKISYPLLIVYEYVSGSPKRLNPYEPLISWQLGTVPYPDHFPFVMYSHTGHDYVQKRCLCLGEKT